MIDFKGKTALITGGSRGIGAECVKIISALSGTVVFTYHSDENAANEVLEKCLDKSKVIALKNDLESEESIKSVVERTSEQFGKIDILINNAGVWNYGRADEMTLDHWERLIRINLTGTFLFTKNVIPIMKKNNFGRIINISSTAGQRGESFHSHYAASKGGMISFTKSLAVELARENITVNSVAPGWVDTDMNNEVFSEEGYRVKIEESIPVGRIASSADVAYPVLFLASEQARHITGEILNVNGGSVLCG